MSDTFDHGADALESQINHSIYGDGSAGPFEHDYKNDHIKIHGNFVYETNDSYFVEFEWVEEYSGKEFKRSRRKAFILKCKFLEIHKDNKIIYLHPSVARIKGKTCADNLPLGKVFFSIKRWVYDLIVSGRL